MKKWFTVILVCLLAACTSGLNGTYTDETDTVSYTFKPDGKVTMNTMGIEQEMDYKVEDDKIKTYNTRCNLSLYYSGRRFNCRSDGCKTH